jgi:DNA repair protein RecO (recombination protein O)
LADSAELSRLIYQTRAIVLRTVKYGETSLIVDMYTEQKGHQTFIINSVRKPKATTPASSLQLLSLVEMVAYHHENRKIHRVKEVRLEYPWRSIPFDMRKSAVVTCLAEICAKCVVTADPHPELFHFLYESLKGYDQPEIFDRDFLIRSLVELSHFLGFGFDLSAEETNRYFDLLEGHAVASMPLHPYVMEWNDLVCLRKICDAGAGDWASVALEVRRRLVDLLMLYYQLHVESLKEVNSLRVYRELM